MRGRPDTAIFGAVLGHRLLIVSDAHLGKDTTAAEEGLLAFLEAAPNLGDCLLINGDLFDFWFAYRSVVPRQGINVVSALGRLRKKMPILMTGGNHDRWGGDFWDRDLGIAFYPHEARFRVGRRQVLAVHGDGITERHWTARALHRITSHPITTTSFRALHPDLGHWLVDRLSDYLGNTERDPTVVLRSAEEQHRWAEQKFASEPELGLIVMSHTHAPALAEPTPGRHYVNPGAWFDGFRYAFASDEGTRLSHFET